MKIKKVLCLGAFAATLMGGLMTNQQKVSANEMKEIDAKAAIVVEQNSGKILYEKNSEEVLGIASMSKMITQYMVYKAIDEGKITWDTKVPISPRLMKMSTNPELSNVPLRSVEEYTVRELYEAVSIYSANAAVTAFGEYIGGSEKAWVEMMKAQIEEWGITDYQLVNPSGIPNSYSEEERNWELSADAENSMSARSVAIVAQHLVLDYPECLSIAGTAEKTFHPGTIDETPMKNFNYMLPGQLYGRTGVTGLKTGTSSSSGASITVTSTEKGMSLITVVIGSSQPLSRYEAANALLDYAYTTYEYVALGSAGTNVQNLSPASVYGGKDETVSLNYTKETGIALPKGMSYNQLHLNFIPTPDRTVQDTKLKAPLTAGEEVGTLEIEYAGDNGLGYINGNKNFRAPISAAYDVRKTNIMVMAYRRVRDSIRGLFE